MMINRLYIFVCLGLVAVGLSACAQDYGIGARNPQVAALPDKVSLMLADAADRSSTALQTLAAIEQQRTPDIAMAPIENAPPEMKRAMTLNWVGPVEPVLKTLADRAGYGFQTVGNAPPVPIIVSVDAENTPVIEILRSIGLQLGVRADVSVDGAARMVEIHYVPNTGAGG
ncbi:MAG: DotD/TraH family lipoprotein [Alphaproteobacteria bacterium]|nr:DotD/TraH family lipoprotein [Alphaproteobacteria bacterium]